MPSFPISQYRLVVNHPTLPKAHSLPEPCCPTGPSKTKFNPRPCAPWARRCTRLLLLLCEYFVHLASSVNCQPKSSNIYPPGFMSVHPCIPLETLRKSSPTVDPEECSRSSLWQTFVDLIFPGVVLSFSQRLLNRPWKVLTWKYILFGKLKHLRKE